MNKSITCPILLSIFPIISFYSTNKQNYPISVILLPVIASFIFTVISYFILSALLKNKSKSALLVSFFLLLFYSYGHFYTLANDKIMGIVHLYPGKNFFSNEILVILLWITIFLLGSYFCLIKVNKLPQHLTNFFNITAICLVLVPMINVAAYEIGERTVRYEKKGATEFKGEFTDSGKVKNTPDIYYIILDGYGRADVLEEVYNYKNDEFLKYLTEKGFYIAERSRANYGQTALSLTSSLNMQYLDVLIPQTGANSRNRKVLLEHLINSKVPRILKKHGYQFIAFSSGYFATEMFEADIYMGNFWSLNEFHRGLIDSTAWALILSPFQSRDNPLKNYQRKILGTFETIAKLPENRSPFFAFVHITTPHPPFVFNASGKIPSRSHMPFPNEFAKDASHLIKIPNDRKIYLQAYKEQLKYINKITMSTIDSILSKSKSPPIIILQSDHGPGAFFDFEIIENSYKKERFSILNCYYLPNSASSTLYNEITPVNTFRVILNHYFGTNYKVLEDRSHYSTWDHPFHFLDVTEMIDKNDLASFIESRALSFPISRDKK